MSKQLFPILKFACPLFAIYLLMTLCQWEIYEVKRNDLLPQVSAEWQTFYGYVTYGLTAMIFVLLLCLAQVFTLHQLCFFFFLLSPIALGLSIPFLLPLSEIFVAVYTLLLTFWIWGSFFFFWAFANNHFSFRQAGLFYPAFLVMTLGTRLTLPRFSVSLFHGSVLFFFAATAIFLFFLYALRASENIVHESDDRSDGAMEPFQWNYRLILGGLMAAVTFLAVMAEHVTLRTLGFPWHLALLVAMPFFSWLLFHFKGTTWRLLGYGVVFTSIVSYWEPLPIILWLSPLILILKEMSFIAVPKTMRFVTKTWVDLFFIGLGLGAGHVFLYFPRQIQIVSILVAMVLLTATTHYAGRRLELWSCP